MSMPSSLRSLSLPLPSCVLEISSMSLRQSDSYHRRAKTERLHPRRARHSQALRRLRSLQTHRGWHDDATHPAAKTKRNRDITIHRGHFIQCLGKRGISKDWTRLCPMLWLAPLNSGSRRLVLLPSSDTPYRWGVETIENSAIRKM